MRFRRFKKFSTAVLRELLLPRSMRRQLIFGAVFFIVVTVFIGSISIYYLNHITKEREAVYKSHYQIFRTVRQTVADLHLMHQAMADLTFSQERGQTLQEQQKVLSLEVLIFNNLKLLSEYYHSTPDEIKEITRLFSQWALLSEKISNLSLANKKNDAIRLRKNHSDAYFSQLKERFQTIQDVIHDESSLSLETEREERRGAVKILAAVIILSIISMAMIAFFIIRNLLKSLKKLTEKMDAIREGKIDFAPVPPAMLRSKHANEFDNINITFDYLLSMMLRPYDDILNSNTNLEEKTKEMHRLLDAFNKHVIATKTDAEGVITYVSDAYLKVSGFSREELLGHPHSVIKSQETATELYEDLWRHIAWGKEWEGDFKNIKKDGGFFWVHTHITPEKNNQDVIVGFNGISEDISSHKALEDLVKNQQHIIDEAVIKENDRNLHIMQQSRLEQMGEMISMIAHQWRQPLAAITATAGTMKIKIMMNAYSEDYFQEKLDGISDISEHLSTTINDFRGFFKESKETTTVTFEQLVQDCLKIIGPNLRTNNIDITIADSGNEPFETYSSEMKQVILNILKNAEDVLVENKIIEPKIKIATYSDDARICLTIEDNGEGIPESIIGTIFDPYFSTKKEKDGTGLGLYMSKTIVENHCRGSLRAKNINDGAMFIICLHKDIHDTSPLIGREENKPEYNI